MMPAVSSNRVTPPTVTSRRPLPADSSTGAPIPLPADPVDTSMQVDTAALPTDARGFLEQLGPVQAEETAASWPLPLYPDQGGAQVPHCSGAHRHVHGFGQRWSPLGA